mmetsp:Transcript_43323/g.113865  ORF Transcript_43323/g.113865 Transcript_43323/m.113865 type:complete len:314 (-) Transcript_43323:687-1628(-)
MPLVYGAPPTVSPVLEDTSTWRSWIASFFFYADADAVTQTPRGDSRVAAPQGFVGIGSSDNRTPPPVDVHMCESPPTPPGSSSSGMRRTWSAADTVKLSELDNCPGSPSAVERLYCEQRREALDMLDDTAQLLVRELFAIVSGEDDMAENDDMTIIEHNPGYEKDAEQRSVDCARAAAILSSGVPGIHANLTWSYGETLLWMAIEYDHRHPPQMVDVLLSAGADPNAANAIDGMVPLQNPWLDLSDGGDMVDEGASCVEYIKLKRERLLLAGADERHCLRLPESVEGTRPYRKRAYPASGETYAFSRSRSTLW